MEVNRKPSFSSDKVNQKGLGTKKTAAFYYLAAIKNYQENNYEEAEKNFTQGVLADEEDAIAYFNRGTFYLRQSKFKEAIEDLLKAVKFNPKFADAYYNLACSYVQILSFRQSIECLKKAIKNNKEFAKIAENDQDFININKMKDFKDAILAV